MINMAFRIFENGLKRKDKHTNTHFHNLELPLLYFFIRRSSKMLTIPEKTKYPTVRKFVHYKFLSY